MAPSVTDIDGPEQSERRWVFGIQLPGEMNTYILISDGARWGRVRLSEMYVMTVLLSTRLEFNRPVM